MTEETKTEETKTEPEVTVSLDGIQEGAYVMLDFKPEAKLKPAEGFFQREDDTPEGAFLLVKGKQKRNIDLWKVSEIIAVDPPEVKKAAEALQKTAPDAAPLKGVKHATTPSKGDTLIKMNPKDLWVEEGFNPREKLVDLEDLERSMKANGFLPEFSILGRRVVRSDENGKPIEGVEVINGHRRRQAAINAGVEEVTVFLKDHRDLDDAKRLVSAVVANDGIRLTVFEKAKSIKRLLDLGLTRPQVAEKLGKPVRFVTNHMRILESTEFVQEAAEQGKVPAWFILQTMRQYPDDKEMQERRIREASQGVDERKKLRIREKTAKKQDREKLKEQKAQERALLKKTLPRSKAVAVLAEISDAYTAFIRSRSPARESNPKWVELNNALIKVQRMKKRGHLKLS